MAAKKKTVKKLVSKKITKKVTKKTSKVLAKFVKCPHCKKVIPVSKLEKVEDTRAAMTDY